MIENFKITNFKKFSSLELRNLSRVNVFVGNNNSGKSTILEAIFFALSEQIIEAFHRSIRKREINGWLINDEFGYLFYQECKQFELAFSYGNSEHKLMVTKDVEQYPASLNPPNNIKNAILISIGQYFYDEQQLSLLYDKNSNNFAMSNYLEKNICPVWYFNTNLPWIYNEFQSIQIAKKDRLIVNFLQQLDSKIISISLSNNEIYVDVGLEKLIPLRYLGDGIVKIVGILVWVLNAEGGVVLLDEIENGIYYKNIPLFIEYLNQLSQELNVQLFITTHSEDFMRRLSNFSELSLYRLSSRFSGGVTQWDRNKTVNYIGDQSVDIR